MKELNHVLNTLIDNHKWKLDLWNGKSDFEKGKKSAVESTLELLQGLKEIWGEK